jgi:hypothetical protein
VPSLPIRESNDLGHMDQTQFLFIGSNQRQPNRALLCSRSLLNLFVIYKALGQAAERRDSGGKFPELVFQVTEISDEEFAGYAIEAQRI